MPGWNYADADNLPDPDDEAWLNELREAGLSDEQIEQAQSQVRFMADLTPEQRAGHEQQMNDLAMAQGMEARIVSTPEVVAIASLADELDYNRQLSVDVIGSLDPTGNSVLIPILIHRHVQGEDAPAHMRCRAMLKLAGSNDPLEAIMDVPMEQFLALHPASTVRRLLGMPPSESDAERFVEDFWRMIEEGEIEPGDPRLRVIPGGAA